MARIVIIGSEHTGHDRPRNFPTARQGGFHVFHQTSHCNRQQTVVAERGLPGSLDQFAHSMLQRLLRRGDYATSDLQPGAGASHDGERLLIQRIRSGMIMADAYPTSARQNFEFDHSALANWESEGGTTVEPPPYQPTLIERC